MKVSTATLDSTETEQSESDGCSSEGCVQAARWAIRFHGQLGHVHDCDPHTAQLREHCDVAEVLPVADCPWPHGLEWVDQPAPLED